jgi:hypothetical protein
LRLANRRTRYSLAKKCAENSWSVRRLQLEVDRRVPRRHYGGRKQKPPQTVDEVLRVTSRLAGSLVRWVSVLNTAHSPSRNRITMKQLPASIKPLLRALSTDAETLCAKIEKRLENRSAIPHDKRRRSKHASAGR